MSKSLMFLVAGVAGLLAAVPAGASPDPVSQWVDQVNKRINGHIYSSMDGSTGMATVTFHRGSDGRPTDVTAQSGKRAVTIAAMRTVKGLRHLPPLPEGLQADQRISFKMLIGDTDHLVEYQTQRAAMLAAARVSNVQIAALAGRAQVAALDAK